MKIRYIPQDSVPRDTMPLIIERLNSLSGIQATIIEGAKPELSINMDDRICLPSIILDIGILIGHCEANRQISAHVKSKVKESLNSN